MAASNAARAARRVNAMPSMAGTVFEGCSKAFYDAVMPVVTMSSSRSDESLRFYRQLGLLCQKMTESPEDYLTSQQSEDGETPIQLLVSTNVAQISSIRKAVQFAEEYSDEDFEELLKLRNPSDPTYRITWGHVLHLVSCHPRSKLKTMQARCLRNCWSVDMLRKSIAGEPDRAKPRGGRPHVRPNSLPAMIHQIQAYSEDWVTRNQKVWNADENGLFTELSSMAPDDVSPSMLEEVQKLRTALATLLETAETNVRLADQAIEYMNQVLKERSAPQTTPEKPIEPPAVPVKTASRRRRITSV